jgi:hypothetical protein
VTTSSTISLRTVPKADGGTFSAWRRFALVVSLDRGIAAEGEESKSSSGMISRRLLVEVPRILAGKGLVPFLQVRLSLA